MTNNLMKQHTTGSLLNPGQRGLLFDYPSHEALLKPARRVHALEEKQDSQHKTHSRMICMCLVHLTGRKKNTVWPAGSVFPARKLSIICYHQLRLYESFAKYETGCCFIALSIYWTVAHHQNHCWHFAHVTDGLLDIYRRIRWRDYPNKMLPHPSVMRPALGYTHT